MDDRKFPLTNAIDIRYFQGICKVYSILRIYEKICKYSKMRCSLGGVQSTTPTTPDQILSHGHPLIFYLFPTVYTRLYNHVWWFGAQDLSMKF